MLSRSMIHDVESGSLTTDGEKNRLHKSTGNIHLSDENHPASSTIISDGSLKDTKGNLGKPRHLKRRRKGEGKSNRVEPQALSFQDTCSQPRGKTKQSTLVYSKSIDPCARVEAFALDHTQNRSHRRARSASGSTTKLANFWSFIFNPGGNSSRHRQAESVASSS